jgi:hypothetical protein
LSGGKSFQKHGTANPDVLTLQDILLEPELKDDIKEVNN